MPFSIAAAACASDATAATPSPPVGRAGAQDGFNSSPTSRAARSIPTIRQSAGKCAFDRRFPNGPDPAYTIRFDGSNPTRLPIARRLTPHNLDAGNPDWSPNGKRIVFNSFYEGQSESELYTIRPDGTAMHRIRKENKHNYSFDPVWSPDGGRIAFVHTSSTI